MAAAPQLPLPTKQPELTLVSDREAYEQPSLLDKVENNAETQVKLGKIAVVDNDGGIQQNINVKSAPTGSVADAKDLVNKANQQGQDMFGTEHAPVDPSAATQPLDYENPHKLTPQQIANGLEGVEASREIMKSLPKQVDLNERP